ncbi:MAG: hypothetical protein KJO07_22060 [Deltaproteobacteria bacterium]|nr:hypothetical protein [Deltaproteobacteria bacterium]
MRWLWPVALLASLGCDVKVPLGVGPSEGREFVAVIPSTPRSQVDLLVVVDDSGSMAEEQSNLAAALATDLFGVFAEPPSLHIGVTTTNLGGGADASCAGDGDGGRLINTSRVVGDCSAEPGDAYIVDLRLEDGSRLRNYDGTLDQSLACLVQVGTSGCGFEQPLGAARRALEGGGDFSRADSVLAVLLVTDEDDCSTSGSELFESAVCSDSFDVASCPLGPLGSFRCFEQGVTCDQDDRRGLGQKFGCRASDSGLLLSPREIARSLRARRQAPSNIVVGLISPPSGPVVVDSGQGPDSMPAPVLAPACESELGSAAPAPRLASFMAEFPGQASFGSVCEGIGPSLARFGALLRDTVEARPCLRGPLTDIADEPGLQPDCAVFDAGGYGTSDPTFVDVPRCSGMRRPCFRLESAPECSHTETGLAVRVDRNVELGPNSAVVVECKTPSPR